MLRRELITAILSFITCYAATATLPAVRLYSGRTHSCVIFGDTNSSIKCWGNGANKELGTGLPMHVYDPSLTEFVNVGGGVVDLALGWSHTCALLTDGAVKCWGSGSRGQLGYNTTTDVSYPWQAAAVAVGANVTQIVAGDQQTCALLQNSTVKCWGDENRGQLGLPCDWTSCSCLTPLYGNKLLSPAVVSPINMGGTVRRLAAGNYHVCAIFTNNSVVCFGYNNKGQLGLGSFSCPPYNWDGIPASLGVINTGNVTQVAAGTEHTCALFFDGSMRCWGGNTYGQLGYNSTTDFSSPAQVPAVNLGGNATYIFAGSYHTCAILEGGSLRCWGKGTEGQLGTGRFNTSLVPDTPVVLTDGAVAGSAGADTTCALLISGFVECWGANSFGTNGYGATVGNLAAPPGNLALYVMPTPSVSPTPSIYPSPANSPSASPSATPDPLAVMQVTGYMHTCVRLRQGSMKCWGAGDSGQLGYGTYDNVASPADVGYVDVGGFVTYIASGNEHTCAAIRRDDGRVGMKCWGVGSTGQLGYNNTDDVLSPAAVGFIEVGGNVTQIAAGAYHTCVLLEDGTVKCFGDAAGGKLGVGCTRWVPGCICELPGGGLYTSTPATFPAIQAGAPVVQIAAAQTTTCLLLATGVPVCFGDNSAGQMGIGIVGCHEGWDGIPASLPPLYLGGIVTQVVVGNAHVCVLLQTSNGSSVKCWGDGFYGQIGIPAVYSLDNAPASIPVQLDGNVSMIRAGAYHTCALLTNGTLRCFGSGMEGELGSGRTEYGPIPKTAVLSVVPVDMWCGALHTCIVTTQGRVQCFGDNTAGGLGNGNFGGVAVLSQGDIDLGAPPAPTPTPLPSASLTPSPSPSGTPDRVTQVSAGPYHTCALTVMGRVKCWGEANHGQLGYGNTDDVYSPSFVGYVNVGATVTQVVTGNDHTCVLLFNASVKCWGYNAFGQLGYNTTSIVYSPADVGVLDVGGDVTQIAASAHTTCVLLANLSMKCFGYGSAGQLGYGCAYTACACTLPMGGNDIHTPAAVGPIDVGGPVIQISVGGTFVCARLQNASAVCWGANDLGQIGNGAAPSCKVPGWNGIPSALGFLDAGGPVTQLTAGWFHVCLMVAGGVVKCFGSNAYGAVGDGTLQDRNVPTQVSIPGYIGQISAGGYHTCAKNVSGFVLCWGRGTEGQLGNGSLLNAPTPIDIPLGGTVASVRSGYQDTCIVTSSGTVQCWGVNQDGRLGYGFASPYISSSPGNIDFVYVPSPSPSASLLPSPSLSASSPPTVGPSPSSPPALSVLQIVTGDSHTCALLSNAKMTCFGSGTYGNLGYGGSADVYSPLVGGFVDVGGPVIQITAGEQHTCALLANHSVKCFGYGGMGQLGYNSTNDIHNPADVGVVDVGGDVIQVSAGESHTCVLLSNNTVKCFGDGSSGQLGYPCTWSGCQCTLNNGITSILLPADVPPIDLGGPVMYIATGGLHTCAILVNRSLICWGANNVGQLGRAVTGCPPMWNGQPSSLGVLPFNAAVAQVSLGSFHTCTSLVNGSMLCCGYNFYGELGYGNFDTVPPFPNVPMIDTAGNVTVISANKHHTCAIIADGATCWGENARGELGTGDYIDRSSPGAALVLLDIPVYIATGGGHSCVILRTGNAQCWGDNAHGQLGYGDTTSRGTSGGDIVMYVLPTPSASASPSVSASISPSLSLLFTTTVSATTSRAPSFTSSTSCSATPSTSASASSTVSAPSSISLSASPASSTSASPALGVTPSPDPSGSETRTASPSGTNAVPAMTASETQSVTVSSTCTSSPNNAFVSASQSRTLGPTSTTSAVTTSPAPISGAAVFIANVTYEALQMGQFSSENTLVLAAGLPAQKLEIQLSASSWNERVRITLQCDDKYSAKVFISSWVAQASAAGMAHVWVWDRHKPGVKASDLSSCGLTATRDLAAASSSDVSNRYPLQVYAVESKWAEIGDVLSIQPGHGSSPEIIRSAVSGTLSVQAIRQTLCCPNPSDPCDMEICTVTNSSISPLLHEPAAGLFRAAFQRNNASRAFSLVVQPGVPLVLVSVDFMLQDDSADALAPGPYTEDTRVLVGEIVCENLWVAANGHMMAVLLPNSTGLCSPMVASNQDCGYHTLMVEVPSTTGADPQSSLVGSSVQCPPVCPASQPARAFVAPVATSNTAYMLRYVTQTSDDGAVVPVPFSSGSSTGLYFSESCSASGFQSLSFDVCTNTSHPMFSQCPFGAGEACRVCSRGAMCPGGFREWPLPGYFTAAESTGIVVECPAPASRCAGWDIAAGLTKCGTGYQDGSYLCTSCGDGFYTALDGTCTACPVNADVGAAALQLIIFASIVFGALLVLYVFCVLLLRLLGGTTQNLATTFMNLVLWTFITLQIVGQVGKTASTGLPSTVRSMYEVLLVFQFEGATIPAKCTGVDPMQTQWIICVCVLCALCLLGCVYGVGSVSKPLGDWMQAQRVIGVVVKGMVVLMSVSYAPIINSLLQTVTCISTVIPARAYLAMRQDGSALASAGIVLPQQPSRSQLDTMLSVSLLASDPSLVCYESLHATVYPLVVFCIVCYVFVYPVAVVWYVSSTVASMHPETVPKGSNVSFVRRFTDACCGGGGIAYSADAKSSPTQQLGQKKGTSSLYPCTRTTDPASSGKTQHMKAVDTSLDVITHVLLRPFTNAQFRASCIWFLLVDAWLQCSVSAIGIAWRYTSSNEQNRGKAALLCIILLVGASLYETRLPFRVGRGWKTHVKAFSLLLCAMGAIENAMLTEMPPDADGNVSSAVTGWSFLLVAATVVLLLVLAVAFVTSLFAEQKLQATLFKGLRHSSTLCGCERKHQVAIVSQRPGTAVVLTPKADMINNPLTKEVGSVRMQSVRTLQDDNTVKKEPGAIRMHSVKTLDDAMLLSNPLSRPTFSHSSRSAVPQDARSSFAQVMAPTTVRFGRAAPSTRAVNPAGSKRMT